MDFEFETVIGGRSISAQGIAKVDFRCECCNKAHIEELEFESVVDSDTGLDIIVDDDMRERLEGHAEGVVYDDVENYLGDGDL